MVMVIMMVMVMVYVCIIDSDGDGGGCGGGGDINDVRLLGLLLSSGLYHSINLGRVGSILKMMK